MIQMAMGSQFQTLVHSALQGRDQFFSDDYNLIGYSFSFTDPNLPGMYDDLFPLFDGDSPIFTFSQSNVTSYGASHLSWEYLFADIITVGAWNVDPYNNSLLADNSHLNTTDILANGLVEHGPNSLSLSGETSFGTSYATPCYGRGY